MANGLDLSNGTKWWEGAAMAALSTMVAALPGYMYGGVSAGEMAALVALGVNTVWARFKESGPKSSPRVVWFEGLVLAGISAGVAMLPDIFNDGKIDMVEGQGMLLVALTALAARFKESPLPQVPAIVVVVPKEASGN